MQNWVRNASFSGLSILLSCENGSVLPDKKVWAFLWVSVRNELLYMSA